MILPRFDVLVPDTVERACGMLAENADKGVRILAGGTDLLVDLRSPIFRQHVPRCDGCPSHPKGSVSSTIDCSMWDSEPLMDSGGSLRDIFKAPDQSPPEFLISLHKLDGLKGIRKLDDGSLQVGALTTITEIERSGEIREGWTALAEGADNLGSPLVRNRGTIGGNIVNARPAADTAVPTIALAGKLNLQGVSSTREIASESFPLGPGVTVIKPDEILTSIIYPEAPPYSGSAYYKLANRKALEISTVGVAVWLVLDKPGGIVADAIISLGAVGPTPLIAESVKDTLIGKIPDKTTIRKTAEAVKDDARPIDDHRGSAWYRLLMVERITERLLHIALKRAGENR
ncbi:MAG: hypothetical protein GY839_19615 [candidate division Zixibacteria bacterium]|nr:hypothetical protein [candidate division Zixibacteria bacterium]